MAVLVKESWASVTAEKRAPFAAHLTFLGVFLLKGDWYLRQVAPLPGPGPEMLSAAARRPR